MDGGALSNIRRARNRRTREAPLHELYAPPPPPSASSGTLAPPAQQLFCGADLGLADGYDSDGHDGRGLHGRPQMIPTTPERAPPPRKRTRRSNGCGAHAWAARTEGVSTGVVPLEARYFTGETASRLRIGEREASFLLIIFMHPLWLHNADWTSRRAAGPAMHTLRLRHPVRPRGILTIRRIALARASGQRPFSPSFVRSAIFYLFIPAPSSARSPFSLPVCLLPNIDAGRGDDGAPPPCAAATPMVRVPPAVLAAARRLVLSPSFSLFILCPPDDAMRGGEACASRWRVSLRAGAHLRESLRLRAGGDGGARESR
ncbi:hypothetical protein C8J57DRAFT_1605335 [Mycena rebaudengoi]|nr:hypothetical protein C8J57DRAFT_1605335 [Mycena rebaudengoi]